MTQDTPIERSVSAADYVLGTLDVDGRAGFERAMQADPALLAEVYFWQDKLLHLTQQVVPAVPEPRVWMAIDSALNESTEGIARTGSVGSPAAANDAVWRRLRRWQWAGGLSMAAALLLATVLGTRLLLAPDVEPTRFLALLQAPDRSTGWVVEAVQGGRVRLVPLGTTELPPGKSLQFWTKPEGAPAPTSLGLVRADRVTELPASRLPALAERQLFELTLEPEAGSPVGRPTGPILFVGRTVRL